MVSRMSENATNESALLARAATGDEVALRDLFSRYHGRLARMVRVRINRQLCGRVDEEDILQEAYLQVSKQLSTYLRNPQLPFFLWLRHVVGQQLILAHRQHLGTKMRDANRDLPLHRVAYPTASSASIAAQLLGNLTSPSQAVIKAESRNLVQKALSKMDQIDREVLAMRHFEQLSNTETAFSLGIQPSAASNRYVRALDRLEQILGELKLGISR